MGKIRIHCGVVACKTVFSRPGWTAGKSCASRGKGGGYYGSGYIQPRDFFGDGPRVPLIVVPDFTKGGHINHTYTDHVSILKFIEKDWDSHR
jgi:phospholipase C